MEDKLLIRVYAVGFGDCIYVRIPDAESHYHVLIDCGTSDSADILKKMLDDVFSMLPKDDEGKKRLDLLVATHPHADHIKGFNPAWFENVRIGRVWLSAFLKPDHPQAVKTLAFQNLADAASRALLERSGLQLAPGVGSLLRRSVWNRTALKALREEFPRSSWISPKPVYVARDVADNLKTEERNEHKLSSEGGTTCFRGFQDQGTCLRVLAPEWDIDKYYLGEAVSDGHSQVDQFMLESEAYQEGEDTAILDGASSLTAEEAEASATKKEPRPGNISERDFRQLRSRLLYSALAFSQKDDRLKNNVSTVLLLEWRGRRLLFTGDAEWKGTGVEEGRRNSTWDVMLEVPEVKQILLQPLDVLKVAHHGSHNGTPFGEKGKAEVLEKIVAPDRTHVLVSTVTGVHGEKNPVPYPPLLKELGELAANKRKYRDSPEEELRETFQPQRTDLESSAAGSEVRYLQVEIEPAGD